ncbi:MAG: DNA repair protein RadC [Gemmatimonadetes bacterium]|nr:DNA repair protein RadC [Gemmatimonadota bacterium]
MPSYRLAETRSEDRPRERLFEHGPAALTVIELIAIVLGTGTKHRDVVRVAEDLVAEVGGSLRELARRPPGFLSELDGVGSAKAAKISAALELARRLASESRGERMQVRSPGDVYRWCAPTVRDLAVEEFRLLALDSQNRIMREILVTRGILNSSLIHPREVFRAAIAEAAAGIIAVHNHPSGDPTPSADDRAVTGQLVQAGKVLDIPMHDHVIIGGDRYFSFAEAGLL